MPNSDPSPETRFQRGRAKTGGRQKGTLNGLRAAPAKKEGVRQGVARPVGPRPMSAVMKAATALPKVIKDEDGNDLEPVTDQDLGDNPNMGTALGDRTLRLRRSR